MVSEHKGLLDLLASKWGELQVRKYRAEFILLQPDRAGLCQLNQAGPSEVRTGPENINCHMRRCMPDPTNINM